MTIYKQTNPFPKKVRWQLSLGKVQGAAGDVKKLAVVVPDALQAFKATDVVVVAEGTTVPLGLKLDGREQMPLGLLDQGRTTAEWQDTNAGNGAIPIDYEVAKPGQEYVFEVRFVDACEVSAAILGTAIEVATRT